MASRRGVGASIAAAVIFSSILISNFTLVSGEQQKFRLDSLSAEELGLADQAGIMRSSALLSLLDSAQDSISSRTFSCAAAASEIAALSATEADRIVEPGVTTLGHLYPGPSGFVLDPVQGLAPFNGSSGSTLSFRAVTAISAASPDSSVIMHLTVSDTLSLPARVGSISEDCMLNYGTVWAALAGLGGQVCNSSILTRVIPTLDAEISGSSESEGFTASLSYEYSLWPSCALVFTVTEQQAPIQGPAGPFALTVSESGKL